MPAPVSEPPMSERPLSASDGGLLASDRPLPASVGPPPSRLPPPQPGPSNATAKHAIAAAPPKARAFSDSRFTLEASSRPASSSRGSPRSCDPVFEAHVARRDHVFGLEGDRRLDRDAVDPGAIDAPEVLDDETTVRGEEA